MFNMTVHTDRSRFPQDKEKGHGPVLMNGHRKIEGPLLDNLTLCKSWNGCTWQLQRAPESRESPRIPNGEIGLSQTLPIPAKSRDSTSVYANFRRDSPLTRSQSRESPVSLVSGTSSDKNRIARSYDDDSLTTASSNFDSTDQEEEYVTLDRSYIFPRSFRVPSHHTSLIDLQHNSLYSPKVSNEELANQNCRTSPNKHHKFRPPFTRSVSVNGKVHIHETDLDKVDENGRPVSWTKRSLRKIYENINETLKPKVTSPTNTKTDDFDPVFLSLINDDKISIHSEYVGIRKENSNDLNQENSDSGKKKQRKRSKSLGELQLFSENNENELDSDEDGDDFGFKSFPFDHSLAAMHKAKGSSHHRILPKRWRSKPRSSAANCLWSPEGNCSWCNVSGRRLVLREISILQLSEAERLVLQKIALQKLQSMDLSCPVVIPKERSDGGRRKRHMLSFKRSKSANLSGLIHGIGEREKADKDVQPTGMVFGIPLSKCIANDQEIQRRRSADPLRERKESDVIIHRQGPRKSSSSSQGSEENYTQNQNVNNMSNESQKRTASSDSLSESESSRNTSSSLIDALSLSTSRQESLKQDYLPFYATGAPQVPQIVKVCLQHIETYGLRVLGIFRVGASKKRTKQLRDEFDSGKDVKLNDTHNPHEVGALLKEYFRDLPEPLLTRDLYSPFVATRELETEEEQLSATRMLISLLPVPNRDTLWSLLEFLSKVNEHSTDALDESGQTLPGNKMDTHNLATLFGPNILHKAKATEKEFTVESMARAEERKEVIDVVKAIIANHHELFQIPASVHDEILRLLLETDPETTEQIFKRLSNDPCIEPDPDTTTSSLYEDSDASVPHSPVSESHISFKNTPSQSHPPLRVAKSAEMLTPSARRRFFYSPLSDNSESGRNNKNQEILRTDSQDRPKFHLVIEGDPSPPIEQRAPRNTRSHKSKLHRESSDPDFTHRPHSVHVERPHSELYASNPQNLAIPSPNYRRQYNSPVSDSQSNTSLYNPSRSEGLGHPGIHKSSSSSGLTRSGSSSPRMTSSAQRPLDIRRLERTPSGSANDWQTDGWRQWKNLSSDKPNEGFEQETLV